MNSQFVNLIFSPCPRYLHYVSSVAFMGSNVGLGLIRFMWFFKYPWQYVIFYTNTYVDRELLNLFV